MFGPVGPVRITLGAVVLDSPDQSGLYIAKDLIGGWAYLIGDKAGDTLSRSQGGCPGGLDIQLRCAFLLAANQVPDSRQITILVETRQAHRVMVNLARRDVHVIAAIAGRPVSVTTRPDERSSFQVRAAAERAASAMLRDREQADWLKRHPLKELASQPALEDSTKPHEPPAESADGKDHVPERTWRANLGPERARAAGGTPSPVQTGDGGAATAPTNSSSPRPLTERSPALTDWLRKFNEQVGAIGSDGKDVKR